MCQRCALPDNGLGGHQVWWRTSKEQGQVSEQRTTAGHRRGDTDSDEPRRKKREQDVVIFTGVRSTMYDLPVDGGPTNKTRLAMVLRLCVARVVLCRKEVADPPQKNHGWRNFLLLGAVLMRNGGRHKTK